MMAMESFFMASGAGDFYSAFSPSFVSDGESPLSSEASTGYLQDAVAEWGERCKRLRTISPCGFPPPATSVSDDFHELIQEFWGSNCVGNLSGELGTQFQDSSFISDEKRFNWEEETEKAKRNGQEETQLCTSPACSSYESCYTKKNISLTKLREEEERRKWWWRKKKVAYPFAVLKPAGIVAGDVTLAEINERILRRPTRPVRHPVGEFACLPCVPEVGGCPGLSGKAVVGLTRIHTKGRGTITIIRTRG